MNRLILIGNGFDLAHGLKTSYNDFILWYLKKVFVEAFEKGKYNDELISIQKRSHGEMPFDGISEFIDYCYNNSWFEKILDGESVVFDNTLYPNPMFSVQTQSSLFRKLLISCSYAHWVDIENEFYEHLKNELKSDLKIRKENLLSLNGCLTAIIAQLSQYLITIKSSKYAEDYRHILNLKIQNDDLVNPMLDKDASPKETYILNFNYTSTIQNYLSDQKKIPVNYIHGKLNDKRNPLIFGFGDELDNDYLKIERERTRGFFQYIKSFWYFKTANYHNLIRFIDSDNYQVFILGHSCGLSDRTMLNMIFEHENCKSIKIFYYKDKDGNNNFTDLTQEISRHFKNKGEMRKKIVHFENSQPMPQVR